MLVTYLVVLVFMGCLLPYNAHADAEQGRIAGQEAGNGIRSQLDSGDEISERVTQPLTSETTPMQTFGPPSEQETFNAQLTAPSSDVFVELSAQSGVSGDLTGVYVRQDTDFDGNTDYVYNVPVIISGVCANGIISCNAGTWDNCTHYTWIGNDNMEVSLSRVTSIEDLAGCYCINNSCGGDLVWNNLGLILKDLGGGVVAAVQSKNPHCTVTNVAIEGPAIKYYGQETADIGDDYEYHQPGPTPVDGVYFSGTANPEEYYGAVTLPVDEEVASQANDPESYYSRLVEASAQQLDKDLISCTITNNIAFTRTGSSRFDGRVGIPGNNYWRGSRTESISRTVRLPRLCGIDSAFITYTGYDDTIRIYTNGNLVWQDWPGCYERGTEFRVRLRAPISPDYFNAGNNTLHAVICVRGAGEGWFNYHIGTSNYNAHLTTTGGCDLARSCRLKEEKICDSEGLNCVQTWRDFNPTGLTPLPACKPITSPVLVGSHTACMDGRTATLNSGSDTRVVASGEDIWWRIERVYLCQSGDEYDFDNVLQRARHIRDTEQDNVTTLYYEDYDPETGSVTPYSTDLPERSDYETCEKACKLRKPVEDTEAGTEGTTSEYRTTVSSYVDLYRKCEGNICPVEDGETIVKNCTCLNDFPEAASLMHVLDNAADDLTCTEYDAAGNCIGEIYIFSGSDDRCRSDGVTIGFDDCCKDKEFWFGLGQCREGERQLATSKAEGLCRYIGEYCSRELDLVFDTICIEHSKTYCCFNSKLARIVHEQGRPQLQGDISGWGGAESPNCLGFTPEEFQMLDFSRIDLSEWYGDIEVKAQDQIESTMQGSINSFYDKLSP